LRDGSRLNVHSVQRRADSRVTITLSDRRTLEAVDPSAQFVSAVSRIDGEPEGVVWLSALEPAQYRFMQAGRELTWPLGRDQDLFGKPLFLDDDPIAHALVVHAPAQVAYRWDGRQARFLSEISLLGRANDLMTEVGSVECKVLVAREGKLVEVFKSPTMRPSSQPAPVDVDMTDAQLIGLLVEEADQGPIGDHALWRDARLVPAQTAP
jgi:hypothetical protein